MHVKQIRRAVISARRLILLAVHGKSFLIHRTREARRFVRREREALKTFHCKFLVNFMQIRRNSYGDANTNKL